MHELGVVYHIIKSVKAVAEEHQVSEIASVTIELGEVSTVIPSYLTDCWKWAIKKEELLKESKLLIETIPAIVRIPMRQLHMEKYVRIVKVLIHI